MKKKRLLSTLTLLIAMLTFGSVLLVQTYQFLGNGLLNTARQAIPYMNYVTF